MTLSACLIVRDGAQTLARALDSVRPHVDEVCVFDTGSTDGTLELLEELAAAPGAPIIVEQGTWHDDFAEARNRSFAMASCEYAAHFDDDEVLEGGGELRRLLAGRPDAVFVRRVVVWSRELVSWDFGARVVRLAAGPPRWESPVHERLDGSMSAAARRVLADPLRVRVVHHALVQPGRHSDHRRLVDRWLAAEPTPYLWAFRGKHLLYEDGDAAAAAAAFAAAIESPLPWRRSDLPWVVGACGGLAEACLRVDDTAGLASALGARARAVAMLRADPFQRMLDDLGERLPVAGDDPVWSMYADDPRSLGGDA